MKSLIKIEWLKIKKYPVFWWMLGIVLLTYPAINFFAYKIFHLEHNNSGDAQLALTLLKALIGDPFCFPEAWHSIAYFSSFFIVVPAILIIMIINNEYTYKTNRQNIIDGWDRKKFILAKMIDVAIISLAITVVFTLTTIVFGWLADASYLNKMFSQSYYIPLFFLQTFSQLSIAFLSGYFIRKSFLAIGAFLVYYVIIENVLIGISAYYKLSIHKFLPFEITDRLIPPLAFFGNFAKDGFENYKNSIHAIPLYVLLTLVLTSGIWYLCFKNYSKRDL